MPWLLNCPTCLNCSTAQDVKLAASNRAKANRSLLQAGRLSNAPGKLAVTPDLDRLSYPKQAIGYSRKTAHSLLGARRGSAGEVGAMAVHVQFPKHDAALPSSSAPATP